MFKQILPHSEVADYSQLLEEDESELALPADSNHSRPAAIGCIQSKYAKDVLHLPMRTSQMSDNFRKQFTSAFQVDFGMANIVEFGKSALQWSKKVAFDDKYVVLLISYSFLKSCFVWFSVIIPLPGTSASVQPEVSGLTIYVSTFASSPSA